MEEYMDHVNFLSEPLSCDAIIEGIRLIDIKQNIHINAYYLSALILLPLNFLIIPVFRLLCRSSGTHEIYIIEFFSKPRPAVGNKVLLCCSPHLVRTATAPVASDLAGWAAISCHQPHHRQSLNFGCFVIVELMPTTRGRTGFLGFVYFHFLNVKLTFYNARCTLDIYRNASFCHELALRSFDHRILPLSLLFPVSQILHSTQIPCSMRWLLLGHALPLFYLYNTHIIKVKYNYGQSAYYSHESFSHEVITSQWLGLYLKYHIELTTFYGEYPNLLFE